MAPRTSLPPVGGRHPGTRPGSSIRRRRDSRARRGHRRARDHRRRRPSNDPRHAAVRDPPGRGRLEPDRRPSRAAATRSERELPRRRRSATVAVDLAAAATTASPPRGTSTVPHERRRAATATTCSPAGSATDVLAGGTGNDTLDGRAGVDDYFGQAGDDTIEARDGNAERISCGAGDDRSTTTSSTSSPSASAATTATATGSAPASTATTPTAAIFPGAREMFENGVDEDCDGRDNLNLDRDADGFPRPCRLQRRQRRDPARRARDQGQHRGRELRLARRAVRAAARARAKQLGRWTAGVTKLRLLGSATRRAARGSCSAAPGAAARRSARGAAPSRASSRRSGSHRRLAAGARCARTRLRLRSPRPRPPAGRSPTGQERRAADVHGRVPRARRASGAGRAEARLMLRARSRCSLPATAQAGHVLVARHHDPLHGDDGDIDQIAGFDLGSHDPLHPLRRRRYRRRTPGCTRATTAQTSTAPRTASRRPARPRRRRRRRRGRRQRHAAGHLRRRRPATTGCSAGAGSTGSSAAQATTTSSPATARPSRSTAAPATTPRSATTPTRATPARRSRATPTATASGSRPTATTPPDDPAGRDRRPGRRDRRGLLRRRRDQRRPRPRRHAAAAGLQRRERRRPARAGRDRSATRSTRTATAGSTRSRRSSAACRNAWDRRGARHGEPAAARRAVPAQHGDRDALLRPRGARSRSSAAASRGAARRSTCTGRSATRAPRAPRRGAGDDREPDRARAALHDPRSRAGPRRSVEFLCPSPGGAEGRPVLSHTARARSARSGARARLRAAGGGRALRRARRRRHCSSTPRAAPATDEVAAFDRTAEHVRARPGRPPQVRRRLARRAPWPGSGASPATLLRRRCWSVGCAERRASAPCSACARRGDRRRRDRARSRRWPGWATLRGAVDRRPGRTGATACAAARRLRRGVRAGVRDRRAAAAACRRRRPAPRRSSAAGCGASTRRSPDDGDDARSRDELLEGERGPRPASAARADRGDARTSRRSRPPCVADKYAATLGRRREPPDGAGRHRRSTRDRDGTARTAWTAPSAALRSGIPARRPRCCARRPPTSTRWRQRKWVRAVIGGGPRRDMQRERLGRRFGARHEPRLVGAWSRRPASRARSRIGRSTAPGGGLPVPDPLHRAARRSGAPASTCARSDRSASRSRWAAGGSASSRSGSRARTGSGGQPRRRPRGPRRRERDRRRVTTWRLAAGGGTRRLLRRHRSRGARAPGALSGRGAATAVGELSGSPRAGWPSSRARCLEPPPPPRRDGARARLSTRASSCPQVVEFDADVPAHGRVRAGAAAGSSGRTRWGCCARCSSAGSARRWSSGPRSGAINGAAVASEPSVGGGPRLAATWSDIERSDVFAGLAAAAGSGRWPGRAPTCTGTTSLRAALTEALPIPLIEDLPVRFQCVAASIEAAAEHWFSPGRSSTPCSRRPPCRDPAAGRDRRRALHGRRDRQLDPGQPGRPAGRHADLRHARRPRRPAAGAAAVAVEVGAGRVRDRAPAPLPRRPRLAAGLLEVHVLPTGQPDPPQIQRPVGAALPRLAGRRGEHRARARRVARVPRGARAVSRAPTPLMRVPPLVRRLARAAHPRPRARADRRRAGR